MPLTFNEALMFARAGQQVKPLSWPPGQYIVEKKQPSGAYTFVREDGSAAQLPTSGGIATQLWELA